MRIQDRLNDLQPYVDGIYTVSGINFVNVSFKQNWVVPDSSVIKLTVNNTDNKDVIGYVLHSVEEGIGVDELFEFVESIINVNIERERKVELLKIKIGELKDLFKVNDLNKLKTIYFAFQESVNKIDSDPFDLLDDDLDSINDNIQPELKEEIIEEQKEDFVDIKPTINPDGTCNCKEDEFCSRCMDEKGL